jgi:two-component system, sensor histidine kinase and response regulator
MSAGPLILDPAGIQRLRGWGGDELVGKMIQLFLSNAPERLRDIQEGLEEGELERVERGAHSLKSSAGNLGAEALRVTCASLEEAAEQGRADEVRGLRTELEVRFRRTIEALENHRTGGAG